jgi:hypothetical protein
VPVRRTWFVVVALLMVSCAPDPDGDAATLTTVDGVALAVPADWSEQPADETPGVVTSRRWAPGEGVEHLQVVVGCDGSAAELAAGAAQAPRDPLVVTDAVELDAPAVPGLDAVHRLRLTLGAGRPDDASTVRVSGLYGEAGDTLVLVEVARRAGASNVVADAILDSVEVDRDTVLAACEER